MTKIIDGKITATEIKLEIKKKVEYLIKENKKTPHLAAVLVGNDSASESYVSFKIKDCKEVGFESSLIRFDENVSNEELFDTIQNLNNDPEIDGFHPVNIGKMVIGLESFVSATPFGITELIKRYNIETSGKNCVIIGRSNIVGRPMSILMSQK